MAEEHFGIKVFVTVGDESFECDLSQSSHQNDNPISFLKAYIAQTTDNPKVLKAMIYDWWCKRNFAYNKNLESQVADNLADEWDGIAGGYYDEKYYQLLKNPSLSGKKLDVLACRHLLRYKQGNHKWYLDFDMLKAIAQNPSTEQSTLDMLSHCGIYDIERLVK